MATVGTEDKKMIALMLHDNYVTAAEVRSLLSYNEKPFVFGGRISLRVLLLMRSTEIKPWHGFSQMHTQREPQA